MSVYCTLPRRHRSLMVTTSSPSRCFNDGSSSTFIKPDSVTSPLSSRYICNPTMSIFPSSSTSYPCPPPPPPPSEYLNVYNSLHYKNNALLSSSFHLGPNLSSWTSLNDYSRHQQVGLAPPTETSDTVTFTESVTSTFDEYSSSTTTTTNPKLYYASDSINIHSYGQQNKNNHQTKIRNLPNFYGAIEEDNSDDDDSGGENVQSSNDDFGAGFSCSIEDITEEEDDDDYLDEMERKQREQVARMFDINFSSSKTSSNQMNPTSSSSSNYSFRSRSRQSLRNLSIRLNKFYRKNRNGIPFKFPRNMNINKEQNKISPTKRMTAAPTIHNSYFQYNGNESTRKINDNHYHQHHHHHHHQHQHNRLKMFWKNKIVGELLLWSFPSSSSTVTNWRVGSNRNKNSSTFNNNNNNINNNSNYYQQHQQYSSNRLPKTLNRYFERYFSFSRFSMRERKKSTVSNESCSLSLSMANNLMNLNMKNLNNQQHGYNNSISGNDSFRSSTSVAGIIKKRPLSMTYDIVRFTNNNDKLIDDDGDDRHQNGGHKGDDDNKKAHMVAAFEQSLSSMTTRLQQLSSTSELKDCELERLRKTIDVLKKQGGSLVGHAKSATMNHSTMNNQKCSSDKFQRYLSSESVNSVSSCGENLQTQNKAKKKSKLKLSGGNTSWIRSSFSRAFKKKSSKSHGRDVVSDVEMASGTGQSETEGDVHSVPSSPMLSLRSFKSNESKTNPRSLSESKAEEPEEIKELRKQLREKDMQLTDMRLESLTSAHQLENLKEIVNQMRVEMMNLKQDNDRLQRLVNHKSLASSQSSMTSAIGSHGSSTLPSALISGPPGPMDDSNSFESVDMESPLHSSSNSSDGHKLIILGSGSHTLTTLTITAKTNWEQLDVIVKKCFKDHLIRVDSSLSLGITVDSLACYCVGAEKIQRNFYPIKLNEHYHYRPLPTPELLPFGYLVGENHINLQFKSTIDSLAFDTLTPKSVLNEFVSMLTENRRLILAGPSGTGKTYLAHKLAEYMAIKHMDSSMTLSPRNTPLGDRSSCPSGAIVTFNVDHKNAKELRAYLINIAEQCQMEVMLTPLPTVIILDNLHHSSDCLEDIFNDVQKISTNNSPYIIGTINQSVHHHHQMTMFQHRNFRWVTLSVNSEAVKGYLNRFLRRKLLETESRLAMNNQKLNQETIKIIEWIPKVYGYLNKFLENYFGENISIGARLFTSCPMDLNGSQAWFTDLWNYSILPFIIENLREHVRQNNGKLKSKSNNNNFIDPTDWIVANYPWTLNAEWSDHLNRLRPEDIIEDGSKVAQINHQETSSNNSLLMMDSLEQSSKDIKDPFLQMLLKLKEASEYSSQDISGSKLEHVN